MKNTLEAILEESFLNYSAFVLQRRAIPDARDGMKYTARQILHAQHKDKLDCHHPFKKSQKSVSAATSFSYVHGDTSAYEQIIRMGRPLVQRYFMEEINGNGGTPTGSSTYSAPRYTEARLGGLADVVFNYLNMGVLSGNDWSPTYDEEGMFPMVTPSVGFYNLCNGSFGSIGVGLISSIPQFNLREMNEAICNLIDDPDAEVKLYPDFASGGILLNPQTTLASLARGEGKSALVRGVVKAYPKEGYLEVLELPYGVYTNTVCVELEKALDKGNAPFTKFKDLSKRTVQLRIYGSDLEALEKWLYKNTSVQKHFTIKMIMLNNGKTPKLFTMKEALQAHIQHAKMVYTNQYKFQLEQLKQRREILLGLIKAYSILDEVIALIKASSGRADAIVQLMAVHNFTRIQAENIADLRLHRLSSMDIQKIKDEADQNLQSQESIIGLLNNEHDFNEDLKGVYREVAKTYGDKRRTKITQETAWEVEQDGGTANKDFYMLQSRAGYYAAYRQDDEVFEKTKELSGATPTLIECNADLVLITNTMRGFIRKGSDFIMGEADWSDILKLNKDETVVYVGKKDDLETNFEFMEFKDEKSGNWYSLHMSFISCGASKRGKKLVSGKYDVDEVNLCETSTSYPKMR